MNIFVIFLLLIITLLMLKIKLSVYFKFDNFESYIKIQGKFIKFKKKGTLIKRKKKDIKLYAIYITSTHFHYTTQKEKDNLSIALIFGRI